LGVLVRARNGKSRTISDLYWSWIRHVASEEGVELPQSGSSSETLANNQTKRLALALRTRADKIRKGTAPRDATAYVQKLDRELLPSSNQGAGTLKADFDDPDSLDEIASFFDGSGGATLTY
jgi:hypothetical protein